MRPSATQPGTGEGERWGGRLGDGSTFRTRPREPRGGGVCGDELRVCRSGGVLTVLIYHHTASRCI